MIKYINCQSVPPPKQWVAWALTREETETKATERKDDFRADPNLPHLNQVESNDYRKSGYDRGHMCPAADMKWSTEAMSDCFYMSNICPQVPALNQKWWEHLERACRRWDRCKLIYGSWTVSYLPALSNSRSKGCNETGSCNN